MGYWYNDTVQSSFSHTASYTYDALNRLTTAAATGNATYNLTFSYDRYGNMTCVTNGQTDGPCPNLTSSLSTNRLTTSGFTYDAAGNLTNDSSTMPAHTYQWDAEERVKSVDSGSTWSFTYNAVGDRVQWARPGGTDQHIFDAAGTSLGVYGGWDVVWMGGRVLTVYEGSETNFFHVNHLNSASMLTNHAGTAVEDIVFYPWGQNTWKLWGSGGYNFAGMPYYDTNTSTNPTNFRFYSQNIGRWHSPDPLGGDITNPQSLNRYAYVLNNPTSMTDPLGLGDCGGDTIDTCGNVPPTGGGHYGGHGGGGSGGGGVGGGATCNVDGVEESCSAAAAQQQAGAAVQCPNNACQGVNGNGQPVYYFASAVGGGYFTYSGAGALFYSIQAALAAGALAAQGASAADSTTREYGTPIYTQGGVYSFSVLQQGPPCDLDTGACGPWGIDVTAIPGGATTVGLGHDHPGTGFGAYSFSDSDVGNDIDTYINGGYWGAVATQPPGRVLIFNPNAYGRYVNGQSNTPPICVWQGPLMGGVPCH
jgi:RHS repeat-associated protein